MIYNNTVFRADLIMAILSILFLTACNSENIQAQPKTSEYFNKTTITRDFLSEGVAVADLNKDGLPDIIAGFFWFEAPNWKRHQMGPSRVFNPKEEYSESFLNMALDVNLDGWDDVVIIDYPGKASFWLENNQNQEGDWKKHIIADAMNVGNESPGFIDINEDGRLDILCSDVMKKQIVWLQAPTRAGETNWTRHNISTENVAGTDRYSHGIGYGDINNDGIKDVVITEGWFEGQDNKSSANWRFHQANLGEACSHMQVLDVNQDGKNDVVSASAHGLGVWWHEQIELDGHINFKTHLMSETTAQTHSSILADLDNNGRPDYITGKRYLAHNGRDAGDADAPILLWFEFTPNRYPYFKEHFIDNDSGAGLNIATHDMNQDGSIDIVIANKNGVFLLENHLNHTK
ncbi:MAG: VCBS repeat-containing protein [Cytophagales bacterium]|nr:VCBS repeat-containing protein [Cytophagales bacterium]